MSGPGEFLETSTLSLTPVKPEAHTNFIGPRDRRRIETASSDPETRSRRHRGRGVLRETLSALSARPSFSPAVCRAGEEPISAFGKRGLPTVVSTHFRVPNRGG